MIGVGVTALAIMLYHLLLVRYCIRRHAARMAALRTLAGEETLAGVDDKNLQTIPIITYNKPLLTDDQTECAVCLGDVENGDMVRLLPNCNHLFHVKCIDEWFVGHASCPVCRVPWLHRCYWSVKDESVTRFQRVSSKVKRSISRVCVGQGQGQGMSGDIP
ncbi:hypothetical protein E3N88_33051 [Mikania micrantha]|uniref:RING-type domain-containing protein n=1 Tax=Mikania micrantha TaxID=192012 RepID=A0A5N6MBF7_9ASTR|nr:hypothetical protein E3N88_33051 [Mikania micrantha]